jgi:hypothetical protein
VPQIQIVRPQNDDLIPQPDASVIEMWRLVPEPFVVAPQHGDPTRVTSGFLERAITVNVTPTPLGVIIRNVFNGYNIRIGFDPSNENKRGAFAYEIITRSHEDPDNLLGDEIVVNVVHTRAVSVRAQASQDFAGFLKVQTLRVDDSLIPLIPPQGTSLSGTTFEQFKVDVNFAREEDRAIFLFELAISFVPYLGTLYNLSQLVFELATGHDFWGREVTGADMLINGVAALLPFAKALPRPALQLVRKELQAGRLALALDDKVISEVSRLGERELLEAVGTLDVKSATDFARLLTRFSAGQLTAREVLTRFDNLVGRAYLRELDRRVVDQLMTANFKTFRNPRLADGFNAFTAKKVAKGVTHDLDPISWALSQRGKSRYIQDLESELGANWADTLKRAKASDGRLRPLTSTDISHYDAMAGRVEDYRTLAKLNRGHGEQYEVDHILEQRFWRNDPRVQTAFNEKGEGMAMVIPKNPAIAAKMPGKPIPYVHTTKTRMLSDLIPNGREAQFSVQQIYDAHMFVLDALKVDPSVRLGERLTSDFQRLARARGERLFLRVPEASALTRQKGWPTLAGVL